MAGRRERRPQSHFFGEDARKIEVHLIGFAGDVYGKQIEVEFVTRLRENEAIPRVVNELVEQLKKDIEQAKQALA